MKHRGTVYSDKQTKCHEDFEFLCDAVDYCNKNAERGDKCVVSEVYQTLTGTVDYGTITTWVDNKEWA